MENLVLAGLTCRVPLAPRAERSPDASDQDSVTRWAIRLRHFERHLAGFFAGLRLLCGQLVEQHDFRLLIVRDVRVAVDSQIGPCPGGVVGEELAFCGHRVQPKVAMSLPVPLQTTPESDLVGRFDPDAVKQNDPRSRIACR